MQACDSLSFDWVSCLLSKAKWIKILAIWCHEIVAIFYILSPKKLDKEKTKQKVIDGIPEVDEKSEKKKAKKSPKIQEVKKSGRPAVNRKAKYPQIYGKRPIQEQKRISGQGSTHQSRPKISQQFAPGGARPKRYVDLCNRQLGCFDNGKLSFEYW